MDEIIAGFQNRCLTYFWWITMILTSSIWKICYNFTGWNSDYPSWDCWWKKLMRAQMIVEVKYRSCNIGYIILYHFWGDWLSASLGVFEDYSASLVMDSSYNWNCSLPQKTESVGVEGDIVSANCCVLYRLLETEYWSYRIWKPTCCI